jgi:hypothetical protein
LSFFFFACFPLALEARSASEAQSALEARSARPLEWALEARSAISILGHRRCLGLGLTLDGP